MAIGAAQVMGFKLMKNFDRPYLSKSISEFWKRWHISLSTWFRDYLYISLGGNRVTIPRWYLNLFIVFLISGLWHGANWTFVIWGALHGLYLIIGIISKKFRSRFIGISGISKMPRLNYLIQVFITFTLVTFAWIFFRAKSISESFYIINKSLSYIYNSFNNFIHGIPINSQFEFPKKQVLIGIVAIALMESVHIMQNKYNISTWIKSKPTFIRWCIYYVFVYIILFFGVFENRQFIYFQF
jgi:alginate O-acetyltransferase complex protein AlgI